MHFLKKNIESRFSYVQGVTNISFGFHFCFGYLRILIEKIPRDFASGLSLNEYQPPCGIFLLQRPDGLLYALKHQVKLEIEYRK